MANFWPLTNKSKTFQSNCMTIGHQNHREIQNFHQQTIFYIEKHLHQQEQQVETTVGILPLSNTISLIISKKDKADLAITVNSPNIFH